MDRLSIHLLGSFQVTREGETLTGFDSDKVRGLLAYLAVETDRPHRREKLAGLLWPDYPERSARTSLRRALTNLRQVIGDRSAEPPYLLITRQTVQFNVESNHHLDVRSFLGCIDTGTGLSSNIENLEEATGLYQGDFLEGFSIPDSIAYEEWILVTRKSLQEQMLVALHQLAGHFQEQGSYQQALDYVRHQLRIDPYQEGAHQQLMWILALTGQRNEALAHFEAYKANLEKELGVAPLDQTQQMYQQLVDGDLSQPPVTTVILQREPRSVGECPYRGLVAFRESDSPFFFGREAFTDRLLAAVNQRSMVAVIVGASGAGKSSTVFAGLLPRLHDKGKWLILQCRPRGQPFHALAASLIPTLEPDSSETDQLIAAQKLSEALSTSELHLEGVVDRLFDLKSKAERILLVVDQFEELYTLCNEVDLRNRFLDMLLDVAEASDNKRISSVVVLLTLRADFMGQALTYRPFADAIQDGSLILGPMNREELRDAIEKPAEKSGAAFETGLVERILQDVGDEPGNLPLLEFALTLLWDRLDQGWMTHVAYEEIGLVDGALAQYAEEIFSGLDEDEKSLARRVFVQLIQPGVGTEDTRRVARRPDFSDDDWRIIQYLANQRLVVTGRDESMMGTVEVVHEALIRGWHRIQIWMNADRAFRTWQESLRAAMQGWWTSDQDDGALLRGAPLNQAETWIEERGEDLSDGEIAYIQASVNYRESEQARRDRWRRRTITGLAVGFVIVSVLAVLAWQQSLKAGIQARIATARELAAASTSNLEIDPERSILLALEAVNTTYSVDKTILPEAENALHRAVQKTRILHTFSPAGGGVFSPDNTRIATVSPDGTASIWDVESGEEVLTLVGHTDAVYNIAYSWDGRLIATTSDDLTARIWDSTTGEELLTLSGHEAPLISPAFSPDGQFLATSSYDTTVRVWDLEDGSVKWVFNHPDITGGVDFHPDGVRLAVAVNSTPGMAKIYDVSTGQAVVTMTDYIDGVNDIVFSPNGDKIVTVSSDNDTKIRDVETGVILMTLYGHIGFIFGVDISDDGRLLATGGQDGKAKIWDLETGQELETMSGHVSGLYNVAFSPDGRMLSTDSGDGSVKIWDITPEGSREWFTISGHDSLVFGIKYSQDGKYLVSASWDGTAKLWNAQTGENILTLTGHTDRVSGVDISPEGKYLATSSYDGTARIWDFVTGEEILVIDGHSAEVLDVAFTPDGGGLATASGDGTAVIWDGVTGEAVQSFSGHQSWVFDLAISPDGTRLATAGWDNQAIVWDVTTGEKLLTIAGHDGEVNSVAFDPTGTQLVTSSWDTTAKLWDLSVLENVVTSLELPLMTFEGHEVLVWDAAFNPDGTRIATIAFDSNVKLWDPVTGEELITLSMGTSCPEVAFNPDGSRLATGGIGTIQVLAIDIQDLVLLAQDRVTRWFSLEECQKYLHQDECPEAP
jgi:WD40 repeat protein/DNA-binding SARP family transcriptional activator